MQTVSVNASEKYDVRIGSGLLRTLPMLLAEEYPGSSVMLVSDDTVFSLLGRELEKELTGNHISTHTFVFPHGENSKNLANYGSLAEQLGAIPLTGNDLILALGGGVVGDLSGFAAATYRRGIRYIQLPTTLLAAVDSSVGGKTGLNLDAGKNQLGAFHQPALVLCDIDTLSALPEAEYRNGCAEVIKYAMLGSPRLFELLRNSPASTQYENVIHTCVSMKRDYVESDEFDRGERQKLNLGHTVAHAVETCSNYAVSHGQAVAIGMAVITRAAAELGFCERGVYEKLILLLDRCGLPTHTDFPAERLAAAMLRDKKRQGDALTLIVPRAVGRCDAVTVSKEDISMWLQAGGIR